MTTATPFFQTAGVMIAAVASFAMGWFTPPARLPADEQVVAREAADFVHPGPVLAEASRRIGADNDAAGGAEVDTSLDVTANVAPSAPVVAPQPFDVAQTLRRELVAVVVDGNERVALLGAEAPGPQRLTVGAIYRNGWRVRSISPEAVTLAKRREVVRVAIMGTAPDAAGVETTNTYASDTGVDAATPGARMVLTREEARSRRQ